MKQIKRKCNLKKTEMKESKQNIKQKRIYGNKTKRKNRAKAETIIKKSEESRRREKKREEDK